jgi:hypothetical protein
MILFYVLGTAVCMLLTFLFFVVFDEEYKFIGILALIGVMVSSMCCGSIIEKQATYINILKGKENPYKMEIKYNKINDSTFVPIDTIFVEK